MQCLLTPEFAEPVNPVSDYLLRWEYLYDDNATYPSKIIAEVTAVSSLPELSPLSNESENVSNTASSVEGEPQWHAKFVFFAKEVNGLWMVYKVDENWSLKDGGSMQWTWEAKHFRIKRMEGRVFGHKWMRLSK